MQHLQQERNNSIRMLLQQFFLVGIHNEYSIGCAPYLLQFLTLLNRILLRFFLRRAYHWSKCNFLIAVCMSTYITAEERENQLILKLIS